METSVNKPVLWLSCLVILIGSNVANAESYVEKAEQYKKQNNLYKSNYYYMSSIMNKQDLEQAHYGLAENYYSAQDYSQALANLEQALSINSNNVQALVLQARIFEVTSDKAALSEVANKLEVVPHQDEDVLRALDSAHSTLGNREKALQYRNELATTVRETKQLKINARRTMPPQKRN